MSGEVQTPDVQAGDVAGQAFALEHSGVARLDVFRRGAEIDVVRGRKFTDRPGEIGIDEDITGTAGRRRVQREAFLISFALPSFMTCVTSAEVRAMFQTPTSSITPSQANPRRRPARPPTGAPCSCRRPWPDEWCWIPERH